MSRPRKDPGAEWDGEVRHRDKPGAAGFKRWGCRCDQGCMQAGLEIRARARENDKIKRTRAVEEQSFKHGLTGYRAYGCRCEVCKVAGRIHNEDMRATGRNRRAYRAGDYVRPQEAVEEPAVDWSEVVHLRPGHGVRRRKRNDDEAA